MIPGALDPARVVLLCATLTLGTALAAHGDGDPERAGPAIAALEVYPTSVRLDSLADGQRLVVLATDADGVHRDVTGEAGIRVVGTEGIQVSDGRLGTTPGTQPGKGEVVVEFGGHAVHIELEVAGVGPPAPPTFRGEVLPVLTARGCNTGGCHGSSRGQDGFHLSLFGYDPAGDRDRITNELPGRRIHLAFPEASLLLRKACGLVPHTGGKLFEADSADARVLRDWIANGARPDPEGLATVESIELSPPRIVLAGPGAEIPLVVRARYSDGTDRDVTDLCRYLSSDSVSVKVDPTGRLTSGEPGEAFLTASFDVHTVGVPVVVLPEDAPRGWSDPAETTLPANYVDELIEDKLRTLRIEPADLCSDSVFLRRAYLDLIGLLPTTEERAAFLADLDPGKRAALVERLLERREFTELWVMNWAELLQIRSNNRISEKAALLYFEWLQREIGENTPIDEMVRRILTASGGTFAVPQTNFFENQTDNLILAENTAQAFLGIRMQCAQCHNHPFDRWTQDDYYGFAAFFAQIGRKRAEDPRERVVYDARRGEVKHPVGGREMAPKFLGGIVPDLKGRDRRVVLAEWLTAAENPWFARSIAGRVWAHFLGRGIVDEVDDFRVTNPPVNGPLLDALAARLVESGWDLRALVRDITGSRAYQRATRTPSEIRGEGPEVERARAEAEAAHSAGTRNFAHATLRRMRAETLLDMVCQVTEQPEKLKGLPLGSRAVEVADGTTSNYFLTTFGRSTRESVCACEVSREPSLSQALHLLNGRTVHDKVRGGGVIARMLQEGAEPPEVVARLFLRCYSRLPTPVEVESLLAFGEEGDDPKELLEDVFWSLLNSREFLFNH